MTHFKQKRSSYRTSFSFGDDELTYSFDNSRAKVGSSVPYHKIPGLTSYREVKLWWLKYVAVFTVTSCVIAALHYWRIGDMEVLAGILYIASLLFLCACLFALLRRHGGITSIPLDPILFVLNDRQQGTILEEIHKRRLEAMSKKLAQVDFNKPYFEEARKFKWLREEGAISEQEYKAARQKIAAVRDKTGMPPPEPGKVN